MFSFNEDFYFEKNCSLDWVKRNGPEFLRIYDDFTEYTKEGLFVLSGIKQYE